METLYIPDNEFTQFVRSNPDWRIEGVDGHMRWIVKIDGVEKIARPESTKDESSST